MYKTFLYNGIELPALPEWDKAVYPYVFIEKTLFAYFLRVLSNPLTPDGEYFRFTTPGLVAAVKSDMSGWGEWSEVTENARTPLWTNTDLYNTDGTLYLAASEPVPILEIQISKGVDRYSYVVGFNLGLAGMAYPYSAPVPVAYLYNGIRLPALPEWDRGVYPYAYILKAKATGEYMAILSNKKCRYISGATVPTLTAYNPEYWKYTTTDAASSWEEADGNPITDSILLGVPEYFTIVWANTDIYENDGTTLYRSADADPVPVYE